MAVRAVMFDIDGVLLDSTAAHRRIWNAWSRLRGLYADKDWPLTHARRPEDTVGLAAPHLDPADLHPADLLFTSLAEMGRLTVTAISAGHDLRHKRA